MPCPRIGMVHWTAAPSVGGVESYLADLVRALRRRSVEVTLITSTSPGRLRGALATCPVVETELLDPHVARKGSGSAAYRRALHRFLRGAVRDHGLEIVHAHNMQMFNPAVTYEVVSLRSDGAVSGVHHTAHSFPSGPVARAMDGFDVSYAVSDCVARRWRAVLKRTAVEVLYLGVDTSRFRPVTVDAPDGGPVIIVHPARLVADKGANLSVRMLARLRAEGVDARLVLTDTPETADAAGVLDTHRAAIRTLIDDLGLTPHIRMVTVPFGRMPALYQRADVVVYPSVGPEPLGLAPLEAMSCARPVLVSRNGGMRETITHGATGLTFPSGNAEAFTERARELVANPAAARRLGANGRRRVLARFSIDRHADAMVARYRAYGRRAARTRPVPEQLEQPQITL
jgi:glycosyltransferase involved in cell wall biosynthesis